jgi:hypothetical protein
MGSTLSGQLRGYIDQLDSEEDEDLAAEEREEYAKGKRFIEQIVDYLIKSRESLTDKKLRSLESLLAGSPDLIKDLLDDRFTREAVEGVPGCVRRMMQLSRMEGARVASHATNVYLREATRTFVFGFPQASISLSRAALEQALKEILGYQGAGWYIDFN